MQPYALDQRGRVVLPSTMAPQVELDALADLPALQALLRRDVEAKAPDAATLSRRLHEGAYASRYALLRDLALHLFRRERVVQRLYERRATRWCDVPRRRPDVFLPTAPPWDGQAEVLRTAGQAVRALPARWDDEVETRLARLLLTTLERHVEAAEDPALVPPTVAEALAAGGTALTLPDHDPDAPVHGFAALHEVAEDVPELEALHRWAMVLHDLRPWPRVAPVQVTALSPDDVVLLLVPRDDAVRRFLHRTAPASAPARPAPQARPAALDTPAPVAPERPYRSVDVPRELRLQPRLLALAAVHGDVVCSNDDVVRNAAPTWSAMTAQDIVDKTGIERRRYTSLPFEELALRAARAALDHAGLRPEQVGAVVVATCTSPRLMPSTATWLSSRLGMAQTYASVDLVAACAGLPYGLAEATRLLQEVERPVLLVCAEKFSDKIGDVRTSRMIFGDGAAALVVGPGEVGDVLRLKTYASGPLEQVTSIVWPDAAWGDGVTVHGPPVKALAGRYLAQMIDELQALPDPDGQAASLFDSVDLVVPHQANRTMVVQLAERAGLPEHRLYFNIAAVGNTSSASIPLALHDAVRDGVIDRPLRVFAPGFGAGAVAGYAVLRVDPAVVAVTPAT